MSDFLFPRVDPSTGKIDPAVVPPVSWSAITGKPAVIAAGTDAAAARLAIGAAPSTLGGLTQSADLVFAGTVVPRIGTLGWAAPTSITIVGVIAHWVAEGSVTVGFRVNVGGGSIGEYSSSTGLTVDNGLSIEVFPYSIITADVTSVSVAGAVTDMVIQVRWTAS